MTGLRGFAKFLVANEGRRRCGGGGGFHFSDYRGGGWPPAAAWSDGRPAARLFLLRITSAGLNLSRWGAVLWEEESYLRKFWFRGSARYPLIP